MMNEIRAIVAATTILILTGTASMAGDGAKEYDPSEFGSPDAIARGAKQLLQKNGIKKISAQDISRVAIVEFSVEYITKEKQLSNAGKKIRGGKFGIGTLFQKGAEMAGAGEKQVEIEEELKETLPQELYDLLVQELDSGGFAVIPKEEIVANPAYETFKTAETGKKRGEANGGGIGVMSKTTKVDVYPVEGLSTFKKGAFSLMSNAKTEAKLMADLGADMTIRVHLRVGAHRKGKPSIEAATTFNIAAGLRSGQAPGGKMSHSLKDMGTISAKKALAYNTEIVEDKQFELGRGTVITVNSEKYENALREMFTPFAQMVVSTL